MTVKESILSPQTWVPLSGVLVVGFAIFGWLTSAHEEAMDAQRESWESITKREREWHAWQLEDQQMLRHRYTACIGISDMANPKPRQFSWKTSKLNALVEKAKQKQKELGL